MTPYGSAVPRIWWPSPIPFSEKVEAGIGAADTAPESFATEGDATPEGSFELTSERGGQEGGGRVVTINLNL